MAFRLAVLLVALSLVAGYVDATAFFGLGVFTANQTGNTVLLGGAIAGHFIPNIPRIGGAALPALSLAMFIVGSFAAALALRGETGRPPVRTLAVLAAVTLLLGFTALLEHRGGGSTAPLAVAILSLVMGMQSVAATRAGVPGVSTTVVTGTLVRAVLDFEGTLPRTPAVRAEGWTNAAVWASYLGGAVAGAVGLHVLGPNALWVPAAVVALLLPVV